MHEKLLKAKAWAKRNRSGLIVGGVTIPIILFQDRGIRSLNQFLTEKELFNEYYFPEE